MCLFCSSGVQAITGVQQARSVSMPQTALFMALLVPWNYDHGDTDSKSSFIVPDSRLAGKHPPIAMTAIMWMGVLQKHYIILCGVTMVVW